MKHFKYRTAALVISILAACVFCFCAFAEEAAGTDSEAAPETDYTGGIMTSEEAALHRLWAFFSAWAEDDADWMMNMCAYDWRKEKEDPRQALQALIDSFKPRAYAVAGISGEDGDPVRTVSVILQRETEDGSYLYSRHEIVMRLEPDGFYTFDPDGIGTGIPAEAASDEGMIMLTPEGIIRSNLETHGEKGLYDKLIPVNASAETNGIRMEVVSALVRGKEAWFIISLQDTEGKYGEYKLNPSFLQSIDGSYSYWWSELYHDKVERKYTYFICQDLEQQARPEERKVSVGIASIRIDEEKNVDLVPLLEQYGKTAEGVAPPVLEEHRFTSEDPAVPEDIKILDCNQPLDIPLLRDVCLTGIGWIDGRLHMQFRNGGREFLDVKDGRAGTVSVWASISVYGKTYWETDVNYSPLYWDGNSNGWSEWSEFIFNCAPEDAEEKRLTASVSVSVTKEILANEWTVWIPLNEICVSDPEPEEAGGEAADKAAAEGKAPETADSARTEDAGFSGAYPSIMEDYKLYTLWEFFCRWAQADTDNLPFSLTDEQKYGGIGTEAMIGKLMEEGTPLAYQINSETNGDEFTDRKFTCTVLMDPGNGEEPQYRRYEFNMKSEGWGYRVDLGSLACLGPAERDPAVKTVSLSAETIINDQLDYFDPGVREQLCPIGVSKEANGIRMEMISGMVKDNQAWLLYSLEDLDGKFKFGSIDVAYLQNDIGTQESFSTSVLYHNRKENKAYLMWNPHYSEPVRTENRTVTLNLENIYCVQNIWADLVPLVKQFGGTAEGVQAPENIWDNDNQEPYNLKDLKVLDYTRPLNMRLLDNVAVTGIGWIDGRLHIQLRLTDPLMWSLDVDDNLEGEGSRRASSGELEWAAEDGSIWYEYIFDYKPEDVDRLTLRINASVGQVNLEGPWTVRIPLDTIFPAAEGGKIVYDPDLGGCVYTLDGIRYLLNGDGTAAVVGGGEGSETPAGLPETIVFTVTGK